MMTCPNCGDGMERLELEGVYGSEIEVDLCYPCHVLWLDKRESIRLTPGGTIELFRVLNEHRDDGRNALKTGLGCPRCSGRLKLTRDIGKGGGFSYYACPERHGRLTPFSEFLKEKEFVRALSPAEQQTLRAEVKQVRCSGCGAPVDLAEGFACQQCGSPLTVLDSDAVETTLRELERAEAERESRRANPAAAEARARALAALETMRTDPHDQDGYDLFGWSSRPRGSDSGLSVSIGGDDLLSISIGKLFGGT